MATPKLDRDGWTAINKRRSEEVRLKADIKAAELETRTVGESLREKLMREEQVEKSRTSNGKSSNQLVQLPSLTKQAYDASEAQDHEKDLMTVTYELGMFVELRR